VSFFCQLFGQVPARSIGVFDMERDIDLSWIAVLAAIEQLRARGEAPSSDNLPVSVPVLDQMINARWITGVVIRSKSMPWKERIIGIDLTPSGRKMLDERREPKGQTLEP
jgi:hypothetical protein